MTLYYKGMHFFHRTNPKDIWKITAVGETCLLAKFGTKECVFIFEEMPQYTFKLS